LLPAWRGPAATSPGRASWLQTSPENGWNCWNAANPYSALVFKETVGAARILGIELQSLEVPAPADFEGALEATTGQHAAALITVEDPLTNGHRVKIAEFAAGKRLPTMAGLRVFADAGGLMSYGSNPGHIFRRSAD
jgi:putative ABC transport system substrate-binding protein